MSSFNWGLFSSRFCRVCVCVRSYFSHPEVLKSAQTVCQHFCVFMIWSFTLEKISWDSAGCHSAPWKVGMVFAFHCGLTEFSFVIASVFWHLSHHFLLHLIISVSILKVILCPDRVTVGLGEQIVALWKFYLGTFFELPSHDSLFRRPKLGKQSWLPRACFFNHLPQDLKACVWNTHHREDVWIWNHHNLSLSGILSE